MQRTIPEKYREIDHVRVKYGDQIKVGIITNMRNGIHQDEDTRHIMVKFEDGKMGIYAEKEILS